MSEYFQFAGSTSLAVIAYGVYHVCVQLIHIRFDLKRVTLALETRNQLEANRIAAEVPVAQVDEDTEPPVVCEVVEEAPPPPPPAEEPLPQPLQVNQPRPGSLARMQSVFRFWLGA